MAGKIPSHFIDELIGRVDIVDIIDRRVPLTRKGKEFMACCPFHDEKTPSFTVSPTKQFYHCFGCGAHGTAVGFLIEYGNLSFVEAIEELADTVGLEVPREATGKPPPPPGESPDDLLKVTESAKSWFQQQLKTHPGGRAAIEYLKGRGLDGRTAVAFGIGYAPDAWSDLVEALGTTEQARKQLAKVGLVSHKTAEGGQPQRYYDRFRGRVIFPIEDHRGRVVGFGGRILGDGEPKYLNSPETPLFHKGAELYGLHRARRAIGSENHSIVVEGYMDVVSLAQHGIENCVATLGTATTRTHLQRLFRLSPEIIFCFDGDRAGRDAAWKALQVALPEMHDGRQISFLFLADGEDPDTTVREEGADGFRARAENATPLPEFVFDTLTAQVDLGRMDGKARLVSIGRPLIGQLPDGALKEMMLSRLSTISGLSADQLSTGQPDPPRAEAPRRRLSSAPPRDGQISPLAFATSLILQNPELARVVENPEAVAGMSIQGAEVLFKLISQARENDAVTTAHLLESFRESRFHSYLQTLASRANYVDDESRSALFIDTLTRLLEEDNEKRRLELLEKARISGLDEEEKQELRLRLDTRTKGSAG